MKNRYNILPAVSIIGIVFSALSSAFGISKADSLLHVSDTWKYHQNDSVAWADPAFDDQSWQTAPLFTLPPEISTGRGWFRLTLTADSLLRGEPLEITIQTAGTAEIYLDGRLISRLGSSTKSVRYNIKGAQRELYSFLLPENGPFPENRSRHLLAIRYDGSALSAPAWKGYAAPLRMNIDDVGRLYTEQVNRVQSIRYNQLILSSLCLAFTLLFMLLYLFNRTIKINLYFSLATLTAAVNIFTEFQTYLIRNAASLLVFKQLSQISFVLFPLACLRLMYSVIYRDRPRLFIIISSFSGSLVIAAYLRPFTVDQYLFIYMLVIIAEIVRSFIVTRNREKVIKDSWIIGLGSIPLILAILYEMLSGLDLVKDYWEFVRFPTPFYGMVFFLFSMALFLARHFAVINDELHSRLIQVQELSKIKLRQERKAKKDALKRMKLEAENQRKSKELEEARELQLSLLPACANDIPGIDICFSMRTATEVGGDYYDYFYNTESSSMTIVIGDATGHGLKAGLLVSVVKSLFVSDPDPASIRQFFHKCSKTISRMKLNNLFMSLQMIKLQGDRMTVSSAGMPPLFIYRADSAVAEELRIPGLPLGTSLLYPYEERKITLNKNDTVLALSDGLPELLNPGGEMLDYYRTMDLFTEAASETPAEIARILHEYADSWRSTRPQEDDITFVIFRKM